MERELRLKSSFCWNAQIERFMEKILLIEDNAEIRENIAEILELSGYQVLIADNGKAGLRLALDESPDLIICDIMMPVLDGYGVLHVVQKTASLQNTPFIFLTARSELKELRKGMELGADDYITKPFEGTELLNAVERRLKKKASFKAEFQHRISGAWETDNGNEASRYLDKLRQNRVINKYENKQEIYREGNFPFHIYFINKGKVKTFKKNENGKEIIVHLYDEGEFFGYRPILENALYHEYAEAIQASELAIVPRSDFENLLINQPVVMKRFVSVIANHLNESEDKLLATAYNSLRKKVADTLVMLYRKYNLSKGEDSFVDLSRDDLAAIAGVAKESLIRTLSDFRDENLITIQGRRVYFLNFRKLEAMYN